MTMIKGRHGFTLIEVLMASSVFVIFSASAFFLLTSVMNNSRSSAELTKALFASEAKMDEIRALDFESLAGINGQIFSSGRGAVEIKDISPELKQIKVDYNWKQGRKPLVFYTLRSIY